MDNELLDLLNVLNHWGINPRYSVMSATRQGDGTWVLNVKKIEPKEQEKADENNK